MNYKIFVYSFSKLDIHESLIKEKPKAIIENACRSFIKRYRNKQSYCISTFMKDLNETDTQIHIYV